MWRSRPLSSPSPRSSSRSPSCRSPDRSGVEGPTNRSPVRRKCPASGSHHRYGGTEMVGPIEMGDSNDDDDEDEEIASFVVHVEAPATLAGGYVFWADLPNRKDSIPVRVPKGGVQSGQMLQIPLLSSPSWSEDEFCGGCDQLLDYHHHQQQKLLLMVPKESKGPSLSSTSTTSDMSGRWKDGIFSCFRLGVFHPHFWNAWLCPQVLLGQILVRMNMTWLIHHFHNPNSLHIVPSVGGTGSPGGGANSNTINININNNRNYYRKGHSHCSTTCKSSSSSPESNANSNKQKINHNSSNNTISTAGTVSGTSNSKNTPTIQSTFHKIMVLVLLLSLYDAFMAPPLFEFQLDRQSGELEFVSLGKDYPLWHQCLYLAVSLPMSVWGLCVVVRLRAAVRQRYGIPTGRLGRMEDLVCVCLCNCCVMSQMARQTADYEGHEPAACCTPNGIHVDREDIGDPPIDPAIVGTTAAATTTVATACVTRQVSANTSFWKASPSFPSTSSTSTTTTTTTYSPSSTTSSSSSISLSVKGCTRRRINSAVTALSTSPLSSSSSSPVAMGTDRNTVGGVHLAQCNVVESPNLWMATVV